MITNKNRHLIGQARLLRRQGKTYDEIREVIGPIDDTTLFRWLRGIARPPETNRTGMAKPELRRKARQMRGQGFTTSEITEATGIGSGTICAWTKDIGLSPQAEKRRKDRIRVSRDVVAKSLHDRAVKRSRATADKAKDSFGRLSERDLFLAGVCLYWAEGSKEKPWRRGGRVIFTNSDASVIRVFLRWLDLVGIPSEDRRYRLTIHESVDVALHEAWWADQLGIRPSEFQRVTLKRHNPKPRRYNVEDAYHGCLVVKVARSRELYDRITGFWEGIAEGSRLGLGG
jgi:hypothetical protein